MRIWENIALTPIRAARPIVSPAGQVCLPVFGIKAIQDEEFKKTYFEEYPHFFSLLENKSIRTASIITYEPPIVILIVVAKLC
ncbi:MAG: hypothetical protein R2728_09550 [Chitinophagales bacterium]